MTQLKWKTVLLSHQKGLFDKWHLARDLTQNKSQRPRGAGGETQKQRDGRTCKSLQELPHSRCAVHPLWNSARLCSFKPAPGTRVCHTRSSGDLGDILFPLFYGAGQGSKAQRDEKTCPKPHSGELRAEPGSPVSWFKYFQCSSSAEGVATAWILFLADPSVVLVQSSSINQHSIGKASCGSRLWGQDVRVSAQT